MTSLVVLDGTVHEGRMRVNQQEGVEEFKCYLIWQMAILHSSLELAAWNREGWKHKKGCQNVLYSRMMITMMI